MMSFWTVSRRPMIETQTCLIFLWIQGLQKKLLRDNLLGEELSPLLSTLVLAPPLVCLLALRIFTHTGVHAAC